MKKRTNVKKLSIIGVIAAALVAVLGWWWLAGAAEAYKQGAVSFKQQVITARDGIDNEFREKKLSILSKGAPDVLRRGALNLEAAVSKAPLEPKLFGIGPTVDATALESTQKLKTATQAYAGAVRDILAIFDFYDGVVADFQPVKDLGPITTSNQADLAERWRQFAQNLSEASLPSDLQTVHSQLVSQAQTVSSQLDQMLAAHQAGDTATYNNLVKTVASGISTINSQFTSAVNQALLQHREKVNLQYDQLDALLN